MKTKKPKVQYQTVTLFVRYYDDGKMEYCNPYNGEVLFTKQSATGTSPLVDLSQQIQEVKNAEAQFKADIIRYNTIAAPYPSEEKEVEV